MFGLTDGPQSDRPVVAMTRMEYWVSWIVVGVVGLLAARFVLVQPILEALRH
jgi:hypothetical protein